MLHFDVRVLHCRLGCAGVTCAAKSATCHSIFGPVLHITPSLVNSRTHKERRMTAVGLAIQLLSAEKRCPSPTADREAAFGTLVMASRADIGQHSLTWRCENAQ